MIPDNKNSAENIYLSFGKDLLSSADRLASIQQIINQQAIMLYQINNSNRLLDIYKDIPKVDYLVPADIIRAASNIHDSMNKMFIAINSDPLRKQIDLITNGFNEFSKRMAANLASMHFAWDSLFTSDILTNLQRVMEVKEDEVDAFCSAGWPIPPSMPTELRQRVVYLFKHDKTRNISQVIMGYYRREKSSNLNNVVNSWSSNPLFASRNHIFADALNAHKNGKFTLSIPTLFPQIEGVLTEYAKVNNLVAKCGKIKEIYTAVIGDTDNYEIAEWAIVQTLLYLLKTSTYTYTDFDDELAKSVSRRKTTRHTLLHGIDIKYNKHSNSLRTFLLLDAIYLLTLNGNN